MRKQNKKTQERLLGAIYKLPYGTGIKKLQGHNMYRMRVGSIRILYTIDDVIKIISVEDITGPKGDTGTGAADVERRGDAFVFHLYVFAVGR